jgi:Zn ribbon nucleic-acid-binding protein
MASDKKMAPCPTCGKTEHLAVYEYDGAFYVECDNGFNTSKTPCLYRSHPPATSRGYAVRFHNNLQKSAA